MDQDLGAREAPLKPLLDAVEPVVRLLTVQSAGTQTWNWTKRKVPLLRVRKSCRPAKLGILARRREKCLRAPPRAIRGPSAGRPLRSTPATRPTQPQCNADAEHGIGAGNVQRLIEHQRDDHRRR